MKVGVIGGAGYIGSHVVLALQEAGHEVSIFDDFSTGSRDTAQALHVQIHEGDITNPDDLRTYFSAHKPEAIIHLAAKKAAGESMSDPQTYAHYNISGTIELLNAATTHNCKQVVFSSSAAVYGEPQYTPIDEKHPTNPENFYGFTKLEIERILGWYQQLGKLRFAALRYFNAVGYDQQGRISHQEKNPQNLFPLILQAASGVRENITIFGTNYDTRDGTCIRDYVHVSDLAKAHVQALDYLSTHESLIVNLGTSDGVSVKECIDATQKLLGEFPVIKGNRRPGDPSVVIASSSQAQKLLGWKPEITDVKEMISSMKDVY
jgi:UDP-glucose 4-epimerase